MEVRGRHIAEGIPKSVTVSDDEIRDALQAARSTCSCRPCATRSSASRRSSPPTSTTAASSSPAAARCCATWIAASREDTQLPVQLAEDPLTSVVLGAGKMLTDLPLLQKLAA